MSQDSNPTAFDTSVVIRLLDHQIVDEDGRFLGKVDDLAVREDGGDLLVEALMVGITALAPRYPGVLGRWGWAMWRRLSDPAASGAVLVPLEEVLEVRSDIVVTTAARDALLTSFGLENWLRKHLIERIPGARGAGHPTSDDAEEPPWAGDEGIPVPEPGSTGERHRLTELLRMAVVDADGRDLGRISDIEGCAVTRRRDALGTLRLTRLLVGPRAVGSTLGYSTSEQEGPLVIDRFVGALHRKARWHDWSEIADISWAEGRARLDEGGRPPVGQPPTG
ncbi:hypothetical protein O9K63_13010 [Janibacter cremeus]|uniref:PRC-barrel domain-containing protein n=1 Tax=Janibacter cremeus TaxID=1285192 RepID=UPI0023F8607E|nr:hypothetical protein [Janibacter cremeus]WEV77505.1 hypothetical protein O9K63_13010 [Janibacter cremeus]